MRSAIAVSVFVASASAAHGSVLQPLGKASWNTPVPQEAGARAREPEITVALVDAADALPRDASATAAELRAILGEIGVFARVGRVDPGGLVEDFEGRVVVPVVVLRTPPKGLDESTVMGLVLLRHEPPSPVWVYVDNIRRTLGLSKTATTLTQAEDPLLAIALGRVIAHEVVHALAPGYHHSASGLMAPTLGRAELTGPRRPLETTCANLVRRGLDGLLPAEAVSGVEDTVAAGAMP